MGTYKRFLVAGIFLVMVLSGPGCSGDNFSENSNREDYELDTDQGAISGRWGIDPSIVSGESETAENKTELRSIGYLSGYNPAGSSSGIITFTEDKYSPGLNLFCSGHAPVALLMDGKGHVVHEWKIQFEDVWPDDLPFDVPQEHKEFFRRAHLFPNGDLLVIFEYIGIVKLDRNSKIIWSLPLMNHHDFKIMEDGTIVSLKRILKAPEKITAMLGDHTFSEPVGSDAISIVSPDGQEIDQIDIWDAFYGSDYAPVLQQTHRLDDLFHANSVSIIQNPIAAHKNIFQQGDIVVSLRMISTIVVIDPLTKKVKWAIHGQWLEQHQAEYLSNGNILLLDNKGASAEFSDFKRSQVLEIDPLTQKIVWRFNGTESKPLFTHWLGYNQRLDNGNTLISESAGGRLLEVTPGGEVVWEYVSPFRAGKDNELIATLMGAQRYDLAALLFLGESPQGIH
ncbi:MAG: hypothetical protein GY780_00850 [bacterium]|nr:hypothetical protein [bacterium]